MRPQLLSPVYSLRKLNPGLKTSGEAASTALKAGATTNAHTEPQTPALPPLHPLGPGTLCQAPRKRSLAGYHPWGLKESGTTEATKRHVNRGKCVFLLGNFINVKNSDLYYLSC